MWVHNISEVRAHNFTGPVNTHVPWVGWDRLWRNLWRKMMIHLAAGFDIGQSAQRTSLPIGIISTQPCQSVIIHIPLKHLRHNWHKKGEAFNTGCVKLTEKSNRNVIYTFMNLSFELYEAFFLGEKVSLMVTSGLPDCLNHSLNCTFAVGLVFTHPTQLICQLLHLKIGTIPLPAPWQCWAYCVSQVRMRQVRTKVP